MPPRKTTRSTRTSKRTTPARKSGRTTKAPKAKKAPARKTTRKTTARKPAKATKPARKTTARKPAAKRTPTKRTPQPAADAFPTVTVQPMLSVPDIPAEIRWLEALGFQTAMTMPGPGGAPIHAVLANGNGMIHLNPIEFPGAPPDARAQAVKKGPLGLGQSLYVMVPDIAAAHRTLERLGSPIVQEPRDEFWGDRTLMCLCPAGYLWSFAEHVRDVTPEQMAEAMKAMAPPA